MKIVLDTNILLTSLKKTAKNRPIFDAIRSGVVSLVVTTDVLLEYLEIIGERTTEKIGGNVTQLILALPDTMRITVKFRFQLIKADADDNKFVDCAIAGNAEVIVTNDRHFKELEHIQFPKVTTMTSDEFLELLRLMPGE